MNHAIVLAAGSSTRMGAQTNKLFLEVSGKPLIFHTLQALEQHPEIDSITLVINPDLEKNFKQLLIHHPFSKIKVITNGGSSWIDSLEKGLQALSELTPAPQGLVLIQNAANPLPSPEEISDNLQAASEHGAAISGHYATSTVKEVQEGFISQTHNRQNIFLAETPQTFQLQLLKDSLNSASAETKTQATDAATLLEKSGTKIAAIPASPHNFKVTHPQDYRRLRDLMGQNPTGFLVGIGQDSHRFHSEEKGLTLAGVYYPDQPKLEANSDGDVILHALFNAIAQALGEKSLGHFADPLYHQKQITDSQQYLKIMLTKIEEQKFQINNLGLALECKIPAIDPLTLQLKKSLSKICQIPPEKIGITATSGEGLTPFGRGEGIQCFATVSLLKSD